MMPRLVRIITDHYSNSKSTSPSPALNVRKSRIFKVGNVQSSTGISSGGQQEDDMEWLKSPYQKLGEEWYEKSGHTDVIRDMGSKRTVDIEMATWDQLNAKSRVASMI